MMDRRNFVIQSGTVITATALMSMVSNHILADSTKSVKKSFWDKRPNPDDFEQVIMKAIAYGVNAPSPHNTQSWKFEIVSDTEMNLYADENILLPATDPPARQIHLGLGCFAEMLKIGTSILGYQTEIQWFPQGNYALAEIGTKPTANIKIQKDASVQKHELADYVFTRQTNRRVYKGDIITFQETDMLQNLSKVEYSELFFITNSSEIQAYGDLFYKAFEMESRTYEPNEETRTLFRFSEEERAKIRNGVSIPQMGYSGMAKFFAEKSLDKGNKEKWHSDKSISLSLKGIKKGINSSKGLAFFKTKNNTSMDWVKTGQDYLRFNLALAKLNLQLHPYNQIIQEYAEMQDLQKEFNQKINCKAPAKIQMIARLGRAKEGYISYRRFIKDMKI